jgi:hypothetical protein
VPLDQGPLLDRVAHRGEDDVDQLALLLGVGLHRRLGGDGISAVSAPDLDLAQHRADRDGLVGLRVNRRQGARCRRRHFGVDLVGRDVDDGLVRLDLVTDLLAPLKHGPFGHRFAHSGQSDLDRRAGGHCLYGQ